jgi:multiple sugar transport system substrate-binding protein
MRNVRPSLAIKVGSIAIASALLLAGCSASTSTAQKGAVTQADITKAMNKPTTLTFWSWLPGVKTEIALFEKAYPKIKINYTNAGQGTPEYTHLRTAAKAGSGEPDVVQVEYQYIPSFASVLADLTPYSAGLQKQYAPSVYKQVTLNGQLLGIPQDTAPVGNLYRADILASAGITSAPTTWTQYEADAKTLKAKTGDYITNFPASDASPFLALLWQNGASPFSFDGSKTVGINLETPQVKKVSDYWTSMIQQGLVDTAPDFNNDWTAGFASGKYAGWLTAAWGPDQIISSVQSSTGKWRAAPLPQWDPSNPSSGNWGGSSLAVTKASKYPIAAYEFAKFLNTSVNSVRTESTSSQSLYPASLAGLSDPAWVNQKVAFFGGQQVNKLFKGISATINPNWGWLPYMDYAYTDWNNTVAKAITNKTSIYAGMSAWQDDLVAYGKQQGYTVKVGG